MEASTGLDDAGLDLIFREARTAFTWRDEPVPESLLRQLYDVVRMGPTSANTNPARFVFVTSPEGKERLKPHISGNNVEKTMAAPCCVIIAYDKEFYEYMPKLVPFRDVKPLFQNMPEMALDTATRNSAMQGAYLIIAARALGLDAGPMQGFDREGLDAEFFPDGRWTTNFLCNIGYRGGETGFPRMPRLDFEEACRLL